MSDEYRSYIEQVNRERGEPETSDKDIVVEARELLESVDNGLRHGYAMRLLRALTDEVEQLREIEERYNDAVSSGLILDED